MKKLLFLTVLVILVMLASGCAARSGGWRMSSLSLTPPLLTVVLVNNTNLPLEVFENGELVMIKDPAGNWHNVVVPPGGVVSRGYYNFMGSRELVVTVRGVCPDPAPAGAGCVPGQYAGTASRNFYIHTNGQYRTDHWEVNYLRGPRGVY